MLFSKWFSFAVAGLLLLVSSSLVKAALINELRIDQSGTDNDEYVELAGFAGESLDNLTYLVIGDGTGGSGVIEAVVDLTGNTINSNNYFTVAESTFTIGAADLTTTLNFENSDNVTHLLVSAFTGSDGDDLDTDDDGVLDVVPWSSIIDSVALIETPGSGEQTYGDISVGPDGTFVPAHLFRCADSDPAGEWEIGIFNPADSTDTPGAENICEGDPSGDPTALTIPQIQGDQPESGFVGDLVITTGVVSADFQDADQLNGFYIQDTTGDANDLTSDGIYVSSTLVDVNIGDIVTVTGTVAEVRGQTILAGVTEIIVDGITVPVTPVNVTLPESVDGELERYEGMLVTISSPMFVSQNFFLGRYGQMTLYSPDDLGNTDRVFQPTNQFAASSAEAIALAESNSRRLLILDDGQDLSAFGDNPDPVPFLGDPPPAVIRGGDQVSNLTGVLDQGRINSNISDPGIDYRLQPTIEPVFTAINQRPSSPDDVGGELKVASFNVLNYFNTIDTGPDICGPLMDQGCRGADSVSEFTRQRDKIINAIVGLDADIVGLIELENNGFGPDSALQDLVNGVNEALGINTYAPIIHTEPFLGEDVITVGFIYKPESVQPFGAFATLAAGAFDPTQEEGISRQPLVQTFEEVASGELFTVAVNHFKSKRPPSTPQGDGNDDQGDGQGSWNLRRTEASQQLVEWLETDPTGSGDEDFIILGDLNAYAKEDPILALNSAGYTDLLEVYNENDYSFTFDGQVGYLDHALANQPMLDQVTGSTTWHINTDEPQVIDYDQNFNPDGYYDNSVYRSSDHDPLVIGLSLGQEILDEDSDGIIDDADLCPGTPVGRFVNEQGCSGLQYVQLECGDLYPDRPRAYLRCVIKSSRVAVQDGIMTPKERIRLIIKVIRWVFWQRR